MNQDQETHYNGHLDDDTENKGKHNIWQVSDTYNNIYKIIWPKS